MPKRTVSLVISSIVMGVTLPAGAVPTFRTLLNFDGTNGAGPDAGVAVDSAGDVFGSSFGNSIPGAAYCYELSGANHQVLSNVSSGNLCAVPIFDPSGDLYIVQSSGSILELSGANYQVKTPLAANSGGNTSGVSGLTYAAEGNIYGVGRGSSVFELSGPNHTTNTILKTGQAGYFYGLCSDSASNLYYNLGNGSVYELSGSGHQNLTQLLARL